MLFWWLFVLLVGEGEERWYVVMLLKVFVMLNTVGEFNCGWISIGDIKGGSLLLMLLGTVASGGAWCSIERSN